LFLGESYGWLPLSPSPFFEFTRVLTDFSICILKKQIIQSHPSIKGDFISLFLSEI